MRLSKIKLAGFKSFVDPTSIPLPTNLIGIVGPNGCGKSNVIDAVRWVMGESSAKNLRGESMTDVIFNGSSARKPVGQASIELVFDNSDGSLGGQYAQYSEISIKRIVTREGQSQYFQNGTRCRRRDITDIFLGTGLGPRSYSIIEQGMISRLIEARPEDLRVFLEEAAGISKYKERRRETENRIKHTRENMERLTDLRDELGKQLDKLNRQSKTAEKYKLYKDEERLLKGQLTALRWQSLNQQIEQKDRLLKEQETSFEATIAELRHLEAALEKIREDHVAATENFNEVQAQYYSAGADIARIEQSIQHAKERRLQQQDDLKQAEHSLIESQAHLDADQKKYAQLTAYLQENQPVLDGARETEMRSAEALASAERAMSQWQEEWQRFNENAALPAKNAEVERTRLNHLDQQMIQTQQRVEKLSAEKQNLNFDTIIREIEEHALQEQMLKLQCEEYEDTLQEHQQGIIELRESIRAADNELNAKRGELQTKKGRFASLEALQQAALGKQQGVVSHWLQRHGLSEAKRLAENISVDPGWELAVECALGHYLEAICVEQVDSVAGVLTELEQGGLTLFETASMQTDITPVTDRAQRLLSKVNTPWNLEPLLSGVYCIDDLAGALALRPTLAANESVVTKDGVWVGCRWLRFSKDIDENSSVLQREKEMHQTQQDIELLAAVIEMLEEQIDHSRESLKAKESARDAVQSELQQASRSHAESEARIGSKKTRVVQMQERGNHLEQEIQELLTLIVQAEQDSIASRRCLDEAIQEMETLTEKREALQQQRGELQVGLDAVRVTARNDRDKAHEIALKTEAARTEIASIDQNSERMDKQLSQLRERKVELEKAIAEGGEPLNEMAEELEELLSKRVEVEATLSAARRNVELLDHGMRENTTERHKVEAASTAIRNELDLTRMAWQEINVRRQTHEEALQETGFELKQLFDEMPEEANENEWSERVDQMDRRISRLGPINLAAIDEYKQQSERKEYLDKQHEDLTEALETLENAIRKIDKETRIRFKETYEKVNTGLQSNFPRLFGGGQAYLELTGEDLLDTGVTVMARPPGKRNSTIHLLSGGEKALTAVALVFAIFQLNPAPFCMLDEVDAPLDDANVGRFCQMVREMSEQVQFIFITHNKITMELANQLNGVTMSEPGVSRLVAVDVDEAVDMAL
ncbi:MAG: chromosome segregation protein SMC [Gammaproteobacteria bacterium]|nr:chromosome segregation protein SMC [Gammaproteobacteria bacterium]